MPKEQETTPSAPELPHDIAKQYGLHHEDQPQKPTEKVLEADERSLVDNIETDQAVDDIIRKDSDELLETEVGKGQAQHDSLRKQRSFWQHLGNLFKSWGRNKWTRWVTIIILISLIALTIVVPKARYAVLNTMGVRSKASVIVLDNTTQLPLKNVTVTLGTIRAQTDIQGVAHFKDLKLGSYHLKVKRIAFAPYERAVTIGLGSNPLGTYKLEAVGTQYTILITDYLSGKPIEAAEAESEQTNALADKAGKIVLTVEDTQVTSLEVTLRRDGYRSETVTLKADTATPTTVVLVPDKKHVFVARETGKQDVFSIDLDGKNKKLLLAGTGNESANASLVVSPDGNQAALVSARDGARDKDGYQLQTLTFINIQDGTSASVDRAQQIQPVDWIGDRFLYRSTISAASAANSERNRLVAYNHATSARQQLATANQFNGIVSAAGYVYFTASSTDPKAALGLFRIKPDGSGRERLSNTEVWTVLRSSYNVLSLQTNDGWYTFLLDGKQLAKAATPSRASSYLFVESGINGTRIWTDERDGKGVLLLQTGDQNRVLASQSGIAYPIRWAGDKAIIYRVATQTETADYVVSPEGGQPRKLGDVAATFGFGLSY